jgi:5-oxoprolinase (ATP-hydrolysing)
MPTTIPPTAVTQAKWEFWVDRGGTFTDIIGKSPTGELISKKLLSVNPEQYSDATLQGIREILGLEKNAPITSDRVRCVKMGTTVATNALLERKGEPTVLLITKGFRDALRIGYQNRPKIFDRKIVLPDLLYSDVVEVNERIGANGEILTKLDETALQYTLTEIKKQGIKSIAIVFMHAYEFPQHEKLAQHLAQSIGFDHISTSHEVAPLMKLVSRGDTTVVDAYLSPTLNRYLHEVKHQMPGVDLFLMQSSGGLTLAQGFRGKDAILSGPAGGIVGMSQTAQLAGEHKVIGFDMGGTSTDVSHFAGEFERDFETQVAGVRIRAPMMSIHTVAAGGGSILSFDGTRFRVGPQSSGAFPGPTSYGRGGPLSLTDANLLVGKIQSRYFPSVFGASGEEPLDHSAVKEAFTQLSKQCGLSEETIAEGFISIAVEQMANAIKKISVAKGYDVSDYTLQCFGGAGAQHACLVAASLGMKRIMIHPFAGLLSAYGMGLADQRLLRERTIEQALHEDTLSTAISHANTLVEMIRQELAVFSTSSDRIEFQTKLKIKYLGSDTSLEVKLGSCDEILFEFENAYLKRFAFLLKNKILIIESVLVEGVMKGADRGLIEQKVHHLNRQSDVRKSCHHEKVQIYTQSQWHSAKLIPKEELTYGVPMDGPLLITEAFSTIVVEPGWQLTLQPNEDLIMTLVSEKPRHKLDISKADPTRLEIFNNLFMNIAEQMGLRLQNTAHSVNIKERLDFSCAIFDGNGNLIANAPHMPVHLGSMSESVKSIIQANQGQIHDGDVFVLNDPYHGGTHLPDITVITPCFIPEHSNTQPFLYVGSRGHHADVGGITPGSMPAHSQRIEEEGVLITNFKLVQQHQLREQALMELLTSGLYPCRNPRQNLADLRAQIAANEKGIEELKKCISDFGANGVHAYMQFVQNHAANAVESLLKRLHHGTYQLHLDNGACIKVSVDIDPKSSKAKIDFTGTSEQLSNNFNAPKSVTMAAVLYVIRSLIDDDIPLNAGCLRHVEVNVPLGSMLNPKPGAAVVAGNVETSMCITNALMGALGVMASSQPTMNNLTFGNEQYQYYETIAGGSGAGGIWNDKGELSSGFHGTSVVQTHMTNSRLTDPEVLEKRFPVLLQEFSIRKDSAGQGLYMGGQGSVRRIEFKESMTLSILSNGRIHPAFGIHGGKAGGLGLNTVWRADGTKETLGHIDQALVNPGDCIEICTPGGGGFGRQPG